MGSGELMLGVTPRSTSIPSHTPSRFMLRKPGQALASWASWLICTLYPLPLKGAGMEIIEIFNQLYGRVSNTRSKLN